MNSHLPAPESAPAPRRNWTRRLVNLLVALVVVAVAGATFVFSYSGVHAIALFGGVSAQLARYYPGLFDAVLVIACVAAVVLRDGRWWARLWAWLVIVVLLGAIAVTDVLHAMNYSLRPRLTEGIVAAAPVAAVLIAFSLLLTMLRQSRSQPPHTASPAGLTGGRTRGDGELPAPATVEIPSLPAAEASTVEIPALAPSPQLRQPAASIAQPIALPAAFTAPFTAPPPVAEAAVPMPAPEGDNLRDAAAGTATGGAPDAAPGRAADAAPGRAADKGPDLAPTREEPAVAGEQEAEPPTVLTPAVAETPAVPGVPAAPPATAASNVPVVPGVPVVPEVPAEPEAAHREAGPEAAQPPAGPDGAGAGEAGPSGTAPSGTAPSGTAPSGSAAPETAPSGVPEPPTAPVPVPARPPGGIRYAGGAAPKTARSEGDEPGAGAPSAEQAPRSGSPADYWDAEDASPYAGQVYPARDEHAEADTDGRASASGNGHDGDKDQDDGSASVKQPPRRQPPELDDDAPPFATAPFAPVPRLNRVRSMPVPPADDEE